MVKIIVSAPDNYVIGVPHGLWYARALGAFVMLVLVQVFVLGLYLPASIHIVIAAVCRRIRPR